ncbi:hypothetical protein SAMN04488002_3668 [Litoreibacter janthinus]|uniref:VOC domain-containing protein n=1 Tax=Litoreibacter janthinus TaxID=670154 RepID=A0A1I6IC30_9RHOB|nr:hypothetical protein SAMN04488002_3668 [Litoreibacter janthinus]
MYVSDVDASVRFYESLGLARLKVRPTAGFAILQSDGMQMYLHRAPDKFSGNLNGLEKEKFRGRGIIIHFSVANVDEWAKKFSTEGHEVSLGPVDQSHGHRELYFYDPDGYNVVVFSGIANSKK